jgi:hypothetical protein
MEPVRIVVLATLAAIGYGVLHDQITVRICLEYFTVGHPPVFPTESPTLLALGWGVLATWWVGLPLGILLAVAARIGSRPKITAAMLRRPIALLLMAMGVSAIVAAVVGGVLAMRGAVFLVPPLAARVPTNRHVAFLVDLWAHSASYFTGILGGLALVVWTSRARTKLLARVSS